MTASSKKKHKYPNTIVATISEILFECEHLIQEVPAYTEYHLGDGQIYRAAPHYMGKPWYDWAMMPNGLPAHIKCFIDLRELPLLGNDTRYESTVYMIQECVSPNLSINESGESEWDHKSDLFVPLIKVINPLILPVKESQLRLKPVSDIVGPACVMPDLDSPETGAFFRVKSPSEWGQLFISFLNQPDTVQPVPGSNDNTLNEDVSNAD